MEFRANFRLVKHLGEVEINGKIFKKVDKKVFVSKNEFKRTWLRFPEHTGWERVGTKWIEIDKDEFMK